MDGSSLRSFTDTMLMSLSTFFKVQQHIAWVSIARTFEV